MPKHLDFFQISSGSARLAAIDVYNFAALVESAVGADVMRQTHFTAVGAIHQLAGLEGIVCPAAVPTAF
jgi:hypothetical protein